MPLEELGEPPIVEVVCGFLFEEIVEVDPFLAGIYWSERRDDFPEKSLQPAVTAAPSIVLGGIGPMRSWLISANDSRLLQIQADRFYLNWRKQDGPYPRFGNHNGETGVLLSALSEFERFSAFCAEKTGKEIVLKGIELAKIDHLIHRVHWQDFADLANVLPWLKVLADFSKADDIPSVGLRFSEQRDGAHVSVALDMASRQVAGEQQKLLKIESQISKPVGPDVGEDFRWANREINAAFELLIPRDERDIRFQKEPNQ